MNRWDSMMHSRLLATHTLRAIIFCLPAILWTTLPCFPKEGMDRDARIEIIRGLLRESAVVKVPFPRGKKGLRINANGKLDTDASQKELRSSGLAIQAGNPAQITHIEFKSNEIVFELNGGAKSGEKWYQHIDIGVGDASGPMAESRQNTVAYGSSVTIDFGKPMPDLTVPQLKKILTGVLDFERHSPTVLYSPNVTPQIRDAIKNHNVIVGMDRDAVLSSKGPPDRRVREDDKDGAEIENWIYGLPPHVLYITFDGDLVVSAKQY
jgi:hypothetical protein